jgi:ankyrin repeat protein
MRAQSKSKKAVSNHGKATRLQPLLHRVNLPQVNNFGMVPLHMATFNFIIAKATAKAAIQTTAKHLADAKDFLRNGGDVNARDEQGMTALHWARPNLATKRWQSCF